MCFIIQWLPRVRVLMHDFLHYLITTACTQMGAQNRIDFLLFNGEGKAWDVAHSVWTKDKWFFFVNCNDEMFFLFFLFFIIEWPRGMRGRQKTASTYFFPRPSSWFNDPRTCTAARARTCVPAQNHIESVLMLFPFIDLRTCVYVRTKSRRLKIFAIIGESLWRLVSARRKTEKKGQNVFYNVVSFSYDAWNMKYILYIAFIFHMKEGYLLPSL